MPVNRINDCICFKGRKLRSWQPLLPPAKKTSYLTVPLYANKNRQTIQLIQISDAVGSKSYKVRS